MSMSWQLAKAYFGESEGESLYEGKPDPLKRRSPVDHGDHAGSIFLPGGELGEKSKKTMIIPCGAGGGLSIPSEGVVLGDARTGLLGEKTSFWEERVLKNASSLFYEDKVPIEKKTSGDKSREGHLGPGKHVHLLP